jgi:transposase
MYPPDEDRLPSGGAISDTVANTRDSHSAMNRVEVITSVERRRRWSRSEKEVWVTALMEPGANATEIARQAGVDRSLLYRWRQQLLAGAKHSPVILSHDVPAFVPLTVAPPAPELAPATIMIEFGVNVCMKIEGAPDAQTLSNVIGALTANERRPGRAKLA